MSIDYAIMYLQLEDMQLLARQQGGVAYIKQDNHDKLTKIVNIVTLTYAGFFIVLQLTLMILTSLAIVEP